MQFDLPKEKNSIIKVIGVGGGGSNAVNHMFKQGIKDVDFIVCNTDRQVLDASPVPFKIQLGATLTEGLGAGSLPEMGRKAAIESMEELKKALAKTKMLFITAGMGGGTGTGAAPVIAELAREMGILTVSICTLPFSWEGKLRRRQAEEGLAELKKHSDAVLVILNDKIREIYHNLKVGEAFAHADNVLCSAAKCIAELINVALTINVDFNDVRRVMENSGVAIMGSAVANGEGRALKAVTQALNSPLLNDNDIRGARYVLVSITCGSGKDELTMDELAEITDFVQEAAGQSAEMIKGYGTNDSLADKVSVTIIASGFERKNTDIGLAPAQPEVKMVHLEQPKSEATEAIRAAMQENRKVEVSQMTEPMLKSQVIESKSETPAVQNFVQTPASQDEIYKIELKKPEPKAEPLRIEVKLEPVAEVKTEETAPVAEAVAPVQDEVVAEVEIVEAVTEDAPAVEMIVTTVVENTVTEEVTAEEEPMTMTEIAFSIKSDEPEAEVVAEVKVEEVPVAEIPAVVEVPVMEAPAESVAEVKEEEEEAFVEPFLLVKEEEKSVELDITASTVQEQPVMKAEPEVKAVEESKVEAKTEIEVKSEIKKEEAPAAEVPAVNMEVKRTVLSASVSSDPDSSSRVTKIADVQISSLPPISDAEARQRAQEKIQKLRELSFKVKTPGGLAELENEPAYKRKNVVLNDTPHSSESEVSRFTLGLENPANGATGKTPSLRPDNSFLHDKPD